MKSYLKFLSRNKLYTTIEAVGLIISIAFVILIGNYVYQQYAVAYSNPDRDRIYVVGSKDYIGLSWWDKASLEAEIPEVEVACRVGSSDNSAFVMHQGESFNAIVTYGDPELFEFFPDSPIVEGDLETYRLKGQCLVSETFAKRVLGNNPIGKQLKVHCFFEEDDDYTVCGVFRDFTNTMMPAADILLNPEYDPTYAEGKSEPFHSFGNYVTILKVKRGTNREDLEKKVNVVERKNYGNIDILSEFLTYTMPEIYFHNGQYHFRGGNKQVLQILLIVVLLLFISALFNYINLNVALSGKRAKEMATRRLLGVQKSGIMLKYIVESVLFTAVCFALALLLAWFLLPMMNDLLRSVAGDHHGKDWQYVPIQIQLTPNYLIIYSVVIMAMGSLAGLAPAVLASRFAPIDVVRGTFRFHSKMLFSKVFIVFQNVITVVLITLALLMEVQMQHMLNRPLNARSEGLYSLQFYALNYAEIQPLVNRLDKISGVESVGYGRGFAGNIGMGYGFPTMEGEEVTAQTILGDEIYFNQLGLHIIEDFGHPRTNSVWFSKSLANKLMLNDSSMNYYSRKFNMNGARVECVGGVYEDIPTLNAAATTQNEYSAVIVARKEDVLFGSGVMIDVSGEYKETEALIMKAYEEYSADKNGTIVPPAQNGYVQELLANSLQPVKTAMRLVELFMLLSVLISLLGLIAMSTYYSGENTKSIAIRKAFGSDVRRELWRTVKGYMLLVGIAAVIAIPVAVWLCGKYLERFAYRIDHYAWFIVVSVLLTLLMAFLSILWQTLRAARINPANALKSN